MPKCLRGALSLLLAVAGCQHSAPSGNGDGALSAGTATIGAEPVLPDDFSKYAAAQTIEIPVDMIELGTIVRPRAPIRTGPGVNLPLTDWILTEGERVLTFDRVGRWVRVLALKSGHRGWLHEAVIGPATPATEPALTLDTALLPTAFAQHDIRRVNSYKNGQPVDVNIPKGSAFRALLVEKKRALVLVPQTNAAIWVDRKDVQ